MTRTLLLLGMLACSDRTGGLGSAPGSAPSFALNCAPSNTNTAAQLQCVRTDTRNGDVLVVDIQRLVTSNGPTAVGAAPAGRFTTACDATSTPTRADFYCIRLNTETGELLLVNLTKVAVLPPRTQ